jgi:uncharacterized lipoprotein YmbA
MTKTLILCLALALSGCATIEKHVATYVLGRYVGAWTKVGATNDDMALQSSRCILAEAGKYDEKVYRQCMETNGWVLTPLEIK